jgi:alanyl-tRNA synthetase
VEVTGCKAVQGGRTLHTGLVKTGTVKAGLDAVAKVNEDLRSDAARNHTATHLLHSALRKVLGGHVEQAGSLVEPDRLRFDFTHMAAVTERELEQVESLVNDKILESIEVETLVTDMESAKKMGATALFDEKYGDMVRVVKTGDFSMELCGGTHVKNTSAIGSFVLTSESGIAAGVRRIEAVTGRKALQHFKNREELLKDVAGVLKTTPENAAGRAASLLEELKAKEREISSLMQKMAAQQADKLVSDAKDIKGLKVITARIDNLDMEALRSLGDKLKDKIGSGVVVLASLMEGKVNMVAMATKDAVSAGAHSGNIIREAAKAAGGGGGGRPDIAQAGAKEPENIARALEVAAEVLQTQLK